MRGGGKPTPLLTVGMAIAFNTVNAITNGAALAPRGVDLKVVFGVLLFLAGFAINLHSDAVLRRLRKPGETGYAIPYGGLYRWVSCPNYLGELPEWIGFAIAAWTFPALAFAVFTFANLFPRAVAHHRWYREKFPDYPKDRTAIIPLVGKNECVSRTPIASCPSPALFAISITSTTLPCVTPSSACTITSVSGFFARA